MGGRDRGDNLMREERWGREKEGKQEGDGRQRGKK